MRSHPPGREARPTAACGHLLIEPGWSNAPEEASLPYGLPVLQHGRCELCGATVHRRRRVDGWGPWLTGEARLPAGPAGSATDARDGGGHSPGA